MGPRGAIRGTPDRHRGDLLLCRAATDGPGVHRTAGGGQTVTAGEPFGEIESVKAVSDLYSPVSGRYRGQLRVKDSLETFSTDPYGAGG